MSGCVFCRLVDGSLPAAFVYRDDRVVAFMDAGQVNDGHVIVATVPADADDEQRLWQEIRERLDAIFDGCRTLLPDGDPAMSAS